MKSLGNRSKAMIGDLIVNAAGRRNIVRIARFLGNAGRLDGANDIAGNGETMVQQTVISGFPANQSMVVFDVGANVGDWTNQFVLRAAGRSLRLHAFEPVSTTARMFRDNVRHDTVVLNEIALSDRTGSASIAVHGEGLGTNAIVPDSSAAVLYTESIELTTLDEYCRRQRIDQLALVKIDAEGHDLFVLRGARETFTRQGIAVAQFEYNHRWIWSRAFLLDAFEFAAETGYHLGKVTRRGIEFYKGWDKELEKFQEGNYLLCRGDWVARFPQVRWWGDRT